MESSMLDTILKIFVLALGSIVIIIAIFLYCRNLYFVIQGIRTASISVKYILRYIGFFIPLLGVVMGAVSPDKKVLGGDK